MKSWVFAAFLISGCALVACGDNSADPPKTGTTSGSTGSGGNGGTGGSGGSGNGGSGGEGGQGGQGGAGTTSSSSTGIPTCQDTEDTCGRDTNTGCYKCATDGPCKEILDACLKDKDGPCFKLATCLDGCSEKADPAACTEECRTVDADVVEAYDAIAKCTVCQECPDSCGAADEPLCQP
ncbi:hypothetical protein [Sorangium sp. So ce1335]|uniref:hypothetical protein n=1 Tax=Sorangium sp. So ce1335 TaxID=3133335 RepID=UPI003F64293E